MEHFGTIKFSETFNLLNVSLIGELTGDSFNELVHHCEQTRATSVLLDMAKITYMDSSAIGKVLFIKKRFGEQLYLCSIPEFIVNLFKIMKVYPLFKIFQDKYVAFNELIEIPPISEQQGYTELTISNISVAFIAHRLDTNNVQRFAEFTERNNAPYFIINFENCSYIDSTGFSAFTKIHKKFGKNVFLCNISENLMKLFSLIKFDKLFQIFPTFIDVLNYIESSQTEDCLNKNISAEFKNTTCIIHLCGSLDSKTAENLQKFNLKNSEKLVLEMGEVSFAGTEIMSQILLYYKQYTKNFALLNVTDSVMNTLKQFKFDSFLTIFKDNTELEQFIGKQKINIEEIKLKDGIFTIIKKISGDYLTVYPPSDKVDKVKSLAVFEQIRSKNIQIDDRDTIVRIIEASEGLTYKITNVKIAPVIVEISEDKMKCSIFLKRTASPEDFPEFEDLLYVLKQYGIMKGIKFDVLKKIAAEKIVNKMILVAEGKASQDGKDEQIRFFVDVFQKVKPSEMLDGSVDFYDLNTIQNITQNQLLLERTPPLAGEEGYTVTGEMLEPVTGKSADLEYGDNTYFSDDNTKLYAKVSGHLYYDENIIDIHTVLAIESDVDFKTGNIIYNGDILISGSVKPGFKVISKGNIEIKGEVESATIQADGNITVHKGVFGHNKCLIEAGKDFMCNSVQETEIIVGQNMIAKGDIRQCKTTISHSLFVISPKASVIGGTIVAGENINAASIGATSECITEISLDDVPKILLNRRKEFLAEKIKEEKKHLEQLAAIINNVTYGEAKYKNASNKDVFIDELCKFNRVKENLEKFREQFEFYNTALLATQSELIELKKNLSAEIETEEKDYTVLKEKAQQYMSNLNKNIFTLSKNDIDTIEKYYAVADTLQILKNKLGVIHSLMLKFNPRNKVKISQTCHPGTRIKINSVLYTVSDAYRHCSFVLDQGEVKIKSY